MIFILALILSFFCCYTLAHLFFNQVLENKLAYFSKTLTQKLSHHFIFIQPATLLFCIKCMTAGLCLCILCFNDFRWVLTGVLILGISPHYVVKAIDQWRCKKILTQFHVWLPNICELLRSGQSLEQAIQACSLKYAPPLSQEFELVIKKTKIGTPLQTAIQELYDRYPHHDIHLFVQSVSLSISSGTPVLNLLESAYELIQDRLKFNSRLKTLTSQAKMQAKIGVAIPLTLLGVLTFFDPQYLQPLLTLEGRPILYLGASALLVGSLWVYKLSVIKVPW